MPVGDLISAAKPFLRAELESRDRVDVSIPRRLWLYRHGMLTERDPIWSLRPETVDDYLSDRGRSACVAIDSPYGVALKNKVLFRTLLGDSHEHLLPDLLGVVRDGAIVEDGPGSLDSVDALFEYLEDGRVVCKPVGGAKGDLVRTLESAGNSEYRVDGRPATEAEARAVLTADRDLLLEDAVGQADYAAEVYPEATNTVRLVTMLDGDGEPFVAAAMHRFGTDASGTVDNWNTGGLSAGIDPDTGVLGPVAEPDPDGAGVDWRRDHPETGVTVDGLEIPAWDRVRGTVLDLADAHGWLWPYVGWDVVVTDADGSVTVLEGNRNPGVEALQLHQPLLRDERARRFFERHGIPV